MTNGGGWRFVCPPFITHRFDFHISFTFPMFSSSGGIPFRNDSGQTIPAYGVMRITGVAVVEGMPVLTVDQPDDQFHRTFLLNGPVDIPASGESTGYGTAQDGSYPAFALFDDSTLPGSQSSPNLGDHWGVDNGSWKLSYGREGFYVLGGAYGSEGDGYTESTQRTLVRPYEIRQVVCKLTSTLNPADRATATLQQASQALSAVSYSDTAITGFYVYDAFLGGGSLASGTLVLCEQLLDGDKLLVIQSICS
jgi:hypothetical protein